MTTKPEQVCIYCWRTQNESAFHPEHVIPDALGGLLALPDHVCVDCNKWLGANVDHHILKHPDILNALASLGDMERRDRILKHNYDANLVSESGAEFLAHASSQRIALLPQKHPLHGMIYPEEVASDALRKNLQRKQKRLGFNADEARMEIKRICRWAVNGAPGDELHSKLFQSGFRKNTEALHAKLEPKTKAQPNALIAKIAYEFMFLVGYRRFFQVEDLSKRLLKQIASTENVGGIVIYRIKAPFDEPKPFHFIRFYRSGEYPRVDVGFYGTVVYMMFAPIALPEDFFSHISTRFNFPNMVGVQYEQGVSADSTQTIWALGQNNTVKCLNNS